MWVGRRCGRRGEEIDVGVEGFGCGEKEPIHTDPIGYKEPMLVKEPVAKMGRSRWEEGRKGVEEDERGERREYTVVREKIGETE
eukprot:355704-Hanusia_phi.AAC.1